MYRSSGKLVFVATVLVAPLATAATGEEEDPLIYGGSPVEQCQWPTAVAMVKGGALCSGTLVHPQLVTFASHCGKPDVVSFGETATSPARMVPVDHCKGFNQGVAVGPKDYAYCKLAQPVTDVPITPPVYGCEVDELVPGRSVRIVGFGATDDMQIGIKYAAETTIVKLEDMLFIGGEGTGAWSGDSGGPAYIRLADGSWHTIGIVSGGTGAGETSQYVPLHDVVPVLEEESGVDITPCHDVDGTWNPGEDCGFFASAPMGTGNDWANWCGESDPLTGWSATCGAPAVDDLDPPTVTITSPADGTMYPEDPSLVDFEIEASDIGTGVRGVWLEIDGMISPHADTEPPYAFTGGNFPAGSYVIRAVAEDMVGNVTHSAPIGIGVGGSEPPEEGDGGDGDGDGDSDDGGTSGGPGVDPGNGDPGEEGCGCSADRSGTSPAWLLLVPILGWIRRRR